MKKILIITFIFTLLAISLVSAINFDMEDSFDQEETLTARLSGDFIKPPLKGNIYLYRGHVRVGISASIAKVDNDYYICAPLSGKTPNNYTLVIENVEYKKASKIFTEDLEKSFIVTENYTDFLVDKCFLNTQNDFYIEIENLKDDDLDITMNITTIEGSKGGISSHVEDTSIEMSFDPGKTRVNFDLTVIKESSTKLITFSSADTTYTIPLEIFADETAEASKFFAFEIAPEAMEITMNTSDELRRLVYIYNKGTGTLTNIRLRLSESLSPYVRISEESFGQILPESNANLNITIISGGEKTLAGELFIDTDQGLANSMRVAINIVEGYKGTQPTEYQVAGKCADQGGEICIDGERCSNEKEIHHADDGDCCYESCIKKSSGVSGKVIGWILVLIIIAGAVWFFMTKYKKAKKPVDLLKVAIRKK